VQKAESVKTSELELGIAEHSTCALFRAFLLFGKLNMPDTVTTPLIPPRVAHNQRLLDEYLDKHKCRALFPPVSEQLKSHRIEGIFKAGYNPSIVQHRGMTVMAYRYHHDNTASTRIGLCELDKDFKPVNNMAVDLVESALSHEDPRLFEYEDELWMSYVASEWPQFAAAKVRYAKIYKPDHWRVFPPIDYTYPQMEMLEKNHTPFPTKSGMAVIYRSNPKQVIYLPQRTEPLVSEALRWPYGEMRGGTTLLPYNGKLLKFFHSSLRNDMPPVPHRYYVGAMLLNSEPPYNMVAVSKKPVLYGSEDGGDKTSPRFKPNIVFPAGVVAAGDKWLLSVGVNDSACEIVEVTEKDLNL
jgi:predicted GH43/DUF377 family glycosyl hydrolase